MCDLCFAGCKYRFICKNADLNLGKSCLTAAICSECISPLVVSYDKRACLAECEEESGINSDNLVFQECISCEDVSCKLQNVEYSTDLNLVKICKDDFKVFTECKTGLKVWNDGGVTECVLNCPVTSYISGTNCLPCGGNCKYFFSLAISFTPLTYTGNECDPLNPAHCLECTPPYFMMPDNTCVLTCPDEFYRTSIECEPCAITGCRDCVYLATVIGLRCEVCNAGLAKNQDQNLCMPTGSCPAIGHKVVTLTHYQGYTYEACSECSIPFCKF